MDFGVGFSCLIRDVLRVLWLEVVLCLLKLNCFNYLEIIFYGNVVSVFCDEILELGKILEIVSKNRFLG